MVVLRLPLYQAGCLRIAATYGGGWQYKAGAACRAQGFVPACIMWGEKNPGCLIKICCVSVEAYTLLNACSSAAGMGLLFLPVISGGMMIVFRG